MKEASKKLPPKVSSSGGEVNTNNVTPNKLGNDEIISSLLRINNFDSISSIKDESLDIDLSACVTISAANDPTGILNGNSLDFWRSLDESAQNSQLEMTTGSEDSLILVSSPIKGSAPSRCSSPIIKNDECEIGDLKREQDINFGETFLRPDPPVGLTFSPLKRSPKPPQPELKAKKDTKRTYTSAQLYDENKKIKVPCEVKEEPIDTDGAAFRMNEDNNTTITSSGFSQLLIPSTLSSVKQVKKSLPVSSPLLAQTNSDGADVATTPKPIQLYKCLECNGMTIEGQDELSRHEQAAHHIIFKCGECDKDFEQEANFKKHLKTHRSVEARKDTWKKCPDCGKCLKLGSMWMHRKIHSDNKKYSCDVCGQKFVQKINLTHHSRIHTAEKPYECPECQKRFQERSHLQRHQKYHAQTRSYRCEKCGKMYKTERCLKVHNLVHLEQRPFACNVCDKSFISNSKLKQHSNIHTGERPFKCNYCPRDFTNFPNWLKHTRRRHKVDHKTGEQLENIPSYCSKKSTKTPKNPKAPTNEPKTNVCDSTATTTNAETTVATATATKTTTSTATAASTATATNTATIIATVEQTKSQVKRKKKSQLSDAQRENPIEKQLQQTVPKSESGIGNADMTSAIKAPKVKRERKQLMPKQVHKPELNANKTKKDDPKIAVSILGPIASNFPDLHCLSITSAEDLIMEQALEMEECGLYDARVSSVNTDNAISSEAAAALHFKVKNESVTDDLTEEFISLQDLNSRVICSSLESSPFSSPASIEVNPPTTTSGSGQTVVSVTEINNSNSIKNFFPTFPFKHQVSVIPGLTSNTMTITTNSTNNPNVFIGNRSPPPLVMQQQLTQTSDHVTLPPNVQLASTQAVINQLYLPMTMSVPLLVQPNQKLPSVDTILFSNSGFLRGTNSSKTIHHN